MAYLSSQFGQDHSNHSRRVREFRIIANGTPDKGVETKQQLNLEKRPDQVFYKNKGGTGPLRPTGEHQGEETKQYSWEPCVVSRERARHGVFAPGKSKATLGNSSALVPVSTTLNGEPGKSVFDIQQNYFPIGFVELPDGAQGGSQIIMGGVLTVENPLNETLNLGDWVSIEPPTPEEAHVLQAGNGSLANKKGRVPWILRKFNPDQVNLFKDGNLRNTIVTKLMTVQADGTLKFRDPKDLKNKNTTQVQHTWLLAVQRLIEGYADFLRFVDTETPEAVAIDRAAKFVILSGQPKSADALYLDSFFKLIQGDGKQALVENLRMHANNPDKQPILFQNPTQRQLRALMTLKLRVEEAVTGMMIIGARGGKNGDLHLRAYMH